MTLRGITPLEWNHYQLLGDVLMKKMVPTYFIIRKQPVKPPLSSAFFGRQKFSLELSRTGVLQISQKVS